MSHSVHECCLLLRNGIRYVCLPPTLLCLIIATDTDKCPHVAGKTLQTISLLAYLAAYKGIWGPHLVIVPTSVIVNWETELKRFCPGLKALCYYGSAKRRKELRSGWTKVSKPAVL